MILYGTVCVSECVCLCLFIGLPCLPTRLLLYYETTPKREIQLASLAGHTFFFFLETFFGHIIWWNQGFSVTTDPSETHTHMHTSANTFIWPATATEEEIFL